MSGHNNLLFENKKAEALSLKPQLKKGASMGFKKGRCSKHILISAFSV